MAVDTAARRFSLLDFGRPGSMVLIPDGSISAADRADLLSLYSGIAPADVNRLERDAAARFVEDGYGVAIEMDSYGVVSLEDGYSVRVCDD